MSWICIIPVGLAQGSLLIHHIKMFLNALKMKSKQWNMT